VATDLRGAVGRRVRELRRQIGISQEELASRAGLHRNYIGSVERGERDVGINAIARLVKALGTSLSDFFAPFRDRREPKPLK
jgi:transcriptional regulator with XRE-family HTH domain